eukprot:2032800-Alexandrium_andersonii.AAC.1
MLLLRPARVKHHQQHVRSAQHVHVANAHLPKCIGKTSLYVRQACKPQHGITPMVLHSRHWCCTTGDANIQSYTSMILAARARVMASAQIPHESVCALVSLPVSLPLSLSSSGALLSACAR